MKLSDYLNPLERGAKAAFARAIGAHSSDLSDWLAEKRPIPARYAPAIERESGGAVTCIECRPDDWHVFWPNYATQPQTTEELAQPSASIKEAATPEQKAEV